MVFNSITFVIFLIIVFALYGKLNHKSKIISCYWRAMSFMAGGISVSFF